MVTACFQCTFWHSTRTLLGPWTNTISRMARDYVWINMFVSLTIFNPNSVCTPGWLQIAVKMRWIDIILLNLSSGRLAKVVYPMFFPVSRVRDQVTHDANIAPTNSPQTSRSGSSKCAHDTKSLCPSSNLLYINQGLFESSSPCLEVEK